MPEHEFAVWAPTPGIVWSIAPAVGTVSPDGKLSVNIQP